MTKPRSSTTKKHDKNGVPLQRPPYPTGRVESEGEPRGLSEMARHACQWIEGVIKIDDAGTPFKIARFQADVLRDLYATRPDGTRLCHRYGLSIGRKMGKTTFAGAIMLFEMSSKFAPHGEWMFSAAAGNEKQSRIVFEKMCRMVEREPMLSSRFKISRAAGKLTNLRRLNTIEALSTSARAAHGREAWSYIYDEYAQARDNLLLDALEKSGRTTSGGTGLVITTNSTAPGNPWLELLDGIRLAHSRGQMKEWLYRVYAPDLKEVDWKSDEALFLANPGLYEDPPFVEWQVLVNDRVKATTSPSERKNYVSYRLNASSGSEAALVDPVTWKEFGADVLKLEEGREAHKGKPCTIGIDLSKTTDMSAVVCFFPDDGYIRSMAWLPNDRVDDLEVLDKAPYRGWIEDGWLRACKGNTVDYDEIAVYLMEMRELYDVREIRYDPYMFPIFKHSLEKQGLDTESAEFEKQFKPFRQGWVSYTPAIASLEKRIEDGTVIHESDPLLASAIVGMKIKDSGNNASEARQPVKTHHAHRIDAAVALLMAASPIEVEEKKGESVPSDSFLQRMRDRYK